MHVLWVWYDESRNDESQIRGSRVEEERRAKHAKQLSSRFVGLSEAWVTSWRRLGNGLDV
jgi:hypothetical protein